MRTELLFGSEGMEKLKNAKVALFGVGGVGGYVAEALARSGVGNMVLTDNDCVSVFQYQPSDYRTAQYGRQTESGSNEGTAFRHQPGD